MNDFHIKSKQEIKYFQENKENNIVNKSENIELYFDLINGKINHSYSINLENTNSLNNKINTGFIEVSNPNKSINILKYSCEYSFGKEQKLNLILKIKDYNNVKEYPITFTIGEILGNENSSKIFYIKGNEKQEEEILEIKGEKIKININYLTIHFGLKIVQNKKGGEVSDEKKDVYFIKEQNKLYFVVLKNNQKLYESEAFTDDGKFNMVQIPINLLQDNFSILFFNWRNQNLCNITTSVEELTDKNKKGQIFFTKQVSLTEKLNIYNFSSIKEEITFLDYINKGVRIGLDIGIDFTGSNGSPDEPDSLHYCGNDEKKNPYERAILSCASIVANYDYDNLFPVYGFGAIVKGHKKASMCFNINFKDDPNIKSVDNIMKEYHLCLEKIYFSGPTHFAPIINKIINMIKEEHYIFDYQILMILTDGMIDDLDDTIDKLVEGSFYPLSVIIIGIGDSDFSKMEQLDGDEIPLISRNGIKRQRDLVQFVPFNKYEGDETKLIEEVLEEIPRQVIEYYTLNFLYPDCLVSENKNTKIIESKKNNNNSLMDSIMFECSFNPLTGTEYNVAQNIEMENKKKENEFDDYSEIDRKFSGQINLDEISADFKNKNSENMKKNFSINSQGSIISYNN